MTAHAIRCKLTGEGIAMKLDGGICLCYSLADCVMIGDKREPIDHGLPIDILAQCIAGAHDHAESHDSGRCYDFTFRAS
jgi:hypothetical protein